jgi:hypothetical protein
MNTNISLVGYLRKREKADKEMNYKMDAIIERMDLIIQLLKMTLSKTGGTSHVGRG